MSDAVKKFGDVGVVTGHERLDLINQELRLLKLKMQKIEQELLRKTCNKRR